MENKNLTVLGIDPGLNGAIAQIEHSGMYNRLIVNVEDAPVHLLKKKKDYIPQLMADIVYKLKGKNTHAFIEKVHAMPKQGVTSTFSFGKGYGIWLGVLAALQIPYTLVTPMTWKKIMLRDMGDKDASRHRACELFPEYAGLFSRKKDDGRAEALLIAEYGRVKCL
jgi:crossover junction endodeoxyribonuclease RuvC